MGKGTDNDYINHEILGEKCGVFGVLGKGFEAARLVHPGLWALQHRGQESSGIASSDGKRIHSKSGIGLVAHVFQEEDIKKLKGFLAIGHNRYSTSGSSTEHCQPVVRSAGKRQSIALAHNGNLPSTKALEDFLKSKKVSIKGLNDSEMMTEAIAYFMRQGSSLVNAIKKAYPLFTGVFSLLVMDKSKIVALRDSKGIRPLCIGKLDKGFVFASETCALDTVGAEYLQEVKPGEMVVLSKNGLNCIQLEKGEEKLDIFEFIYFARPDSVLLGKSLDQIRQNLGKELAKEYPIKADVVIPVPDSAIPAALGFSKESGIPFEMALIKNRYIHRTFIHPEEHIRGKIVQIKLNPMPHLIKGKDVIVIDDSIVRGTTSRQLINMLKKSGAKKIHLMVSSPPVRFPDFYGINTPDQNELIAAKMSIEEIRKTIGADSLNYLSYKGLVKATGLLESSFCMSCLNGTYPVDIGEKAKTVRYNVATNGIPKKRLAVLISNKGTGTNLQAIIDGIESGKINGQIAVVISDTEQSLGLNRAKKYNIEIAINKKKEDLLNLLKKYNPDFICLAGWKQIITFDVIKHFSNKVLNVHPGLIPEKINGFVKNPDGTKALWNKGKLTDLAIQNFLKAKATYAGSTVHFLSEEFDFGLVLGRAFVKTAPKDNVESLYQRLKSKEHEIYVEALSKLCREC
ncbi:amidophosphoribosyltransferase [Candidatus Daviesbacteria bacterium]|nr:amidophosphoribosyltransferase [Candidatus Daviesbacteria bacterium]